MGKNANAKAAPVEEIKPEAVPPVQPVDNVDTDAPPVDNTSDATQPPVDNTDTDPAPNTPGQYVVAWHIKVNGTRYAPGDRVDLDDDVAAPFLKSGAIVAINTEA